MKYYKNFKHDTDFTKNGRHKDFVKNIIPILDNWYFIKKFPDRYVIETEEYGNLTFYPKADTLLINNINKWIRGCGLQWIIKNLIHNQE